MKAMNSMIKRVAGGRAILLALAIAVGASAPAPAHAQAGNRAVAIVAHRDAPVDNLSFAQLRSIFLGDQQFWPDRSRITLLVRAPVAAERELVLSRIYRMNEAQFRQYWIAKMFRAEVPAGPKIVYTSDMTRELVSAIPGAISFMPASEVTADLKVIRIDGLAPGDAGYPLR
jgi:ABC-type phosphate transport system substrate-binding protein